MDKQQNREEFPEQQAPAKNTDNAFVQVSEDGSPSIPKETTEKTTSEEETERSSRH